MAMAAEQERRAGVERCPAGEVGPGGVSRCVGLPVRDPIRERAAGGVGGVSEPVLERKGAQ